MQAPHSATPKDIVRQLIDCIRQNRPDGFSHLVSASHIDRSNGRHGPDGFVAGAANLHRANSDFDISIEAMVAEGDTVVVRWRETGVHAGPFFNLRPTGRPFDACGVNVYQVLNGKVVESWIAVDPRTIRAQQEGQAALTAQADRRTTP
jgi:predicted ester cyclase